MCEKPMLFQSFIGSPDTLEVIFTNALVRVLQRNTTNRRLYISTDLLWGTGSILEAERSQNLKSVSWRPRRTGGIVLVWDWRPENQGIWWHKLKIVVQVLVQMQEKTDIPSQRHSGRERILYAWPLILFRQSMDWVRPAQVGGGGSLLYWVHQPKRPSHPEIPSHTCPG